MEPLVRLTSIVVPLLKDDVDTDAIIPAAYMRSLATDPATGLFARWRYRDDGSPDPRFVLNDARYRGARILLAGANFGCGSSRENAVWALYDHGIRCVVAPSFGDIFYNNAIGYGLLPVVLPEERMQALLAAIAKAPREAVEVDLPAQEMRFPGGGVASFAIDAAAKHRLVNGLDEIALTLGREPEIAAFEARRRRERPWLYQEP